MAQALSAIAPYLGDVLSMFVSKKSAEDSSALQYKYQTMLNQQNYGYNKKLINMQNAFNESMMDKANDWNLQRWNESVDLANTAHQREMADLKKAGLNPILSANGGASVINPMQSAQTSSGSSQLSSQAGLPEVDYLGAISTANGMRNANKSIEDTLKNSKTNREATNKRVLNETREVGIKEANSSAQIRQIDNNIKLANKEFELEKGIKLQRLAQDIKESISRINYNNQSTAKSKNEVLHYGVDRGFTIGSKKLGIGLHWTTHPNENNENKRIYEQKYENINGKLVPVTQIK